MINNMQIIVYMTLQMALKFPGNTMILNSQLMEVATLDMIDTSFIDEIIYREQLSEPTSFNIKFYQCGFESMLLIENIGSIIWFLWFKCLLVVISLVLWPAKFI